VFGHGCTNLNCLLTAWDAHETELRGYLISRIHDRNAAEDLLQDLFIKALAQGSRFCSLDDPRAWLFRVVRNLCTDYRRRQKPLAELPDDLVAAPPRQPAVDKLAACLPRALTELSAEDSEALTLCDLDGLSQAEYAQRLGLSLPAAKSRVQRARRRLRAHLREACQVRFDAAGNVCCFVPRPPRA
jgi:RNA polymerase sigma-70 factor (ECF subfamily)